MLRLSSLKYKNKRSRTRRTERDIPVAEHPEDTPELLPEFNLVAAFVQRMKADARGNVHGNENHYKQAIQREGREFFEDTSEDPFSWIWCQNILGMPDYLVRRVEQEAKTEYRGRTQSAPNPVYRRVRY